MPGPRFLRLFVTRLAVWLPGGLLLGLALLLPLPAPAEERAEEYELKAAFLLNFAKFVTWPDLPSSTEVDVAIWGSDRTHGVMADALAGKRIGPHALSVRRFSPDEPPPHILFVQAVREPIPAELRQRLASAHTLVVGESPDFAARYGVIGFVRRGANLRFQVNIEAADRAGLKISARLAQLAEIVRSAP